MTIGMACLLTFLCTTLFFVLFGLVTEALDPT